MSARLCKRLSWIVITTIFLSSLAGGYMYQNSLFTSYEVTSSFQVDGTIGAQYLNLDQVRQNLLSDKNLKEIQQAGGNADLIALQYLPDVNQYVLITRDHDQNLAVQTHQLMKEKIQSQMMNDYHAFVKDMNANIRKSTEKEKLYMDMLLALKEAVTYPDQYVIPQNLHEQAATILSFMENEQLEAIKETNRLAQQLSGAKSPRFVTELSVSETGGSSPIHIFGFAVFFTMMAAVCMSFVQSFLLEKSRLKSYREDGK